MNHADTKAWLGAIFRGSLRPRPSEKPWEWAERCMRIPGTENDELAGQLWSSELTPYVRTVMEWAATPGKSEMWISKSSQVGITMAALLMVCWHIANHPANIGYCIDSVDEARKISKIRLKRWISDNRLLDAEEGETEDELANLTYFLRGMTVYLMGAYSKGAFANKSLSFGILDELDKHPLLDDEGTTADLMRERLKRPRNSKLLGFSTPTLESGQTWVEYTKGTQETYHVPCPHCGHVQPLEWSRVTFGTKEFRDLAGDHDLDLVKSSTYYLCELGCRIEHTDKRRMLNAGKWVPRNLKAPAHVRSLHISDLYSPFVSWGELAVEWILAQGHVEKLRRFTLGRLGLPFKETCGGELKEADILRLRKPYRRGNCPVSPILVATSTDIQGDVQKTLKAAFMPNGDIYVLDWHVTLALDDVAWFAAEPVPAPAGDTFATCGLVDEGHRAHDVRRFCLANLPRFWPVKGRGGIQVRSYVGTSSAWIDGQEILTYHCDDDSFKWQLLRRLKPPPGPKSPGPSIFFPEDLDPEIIAELTSERPLKEKNRFGYEKWVWKKGEAPNDWWDCLKYLLVLWAVMAPALNLSIPTPPFSPVEPEKAA